MTKWSPKLEKLIRGYADFELKNARDGADPKKSVTASMLRMAFRSVVTGNGHYKALCSEMGFSADPKSYSRNNEAIIKLAKANNSDAADKLAKTQAFWKKYAGGSFNKIKAGMKKAKQDRFQF
jgi:hypothetical protein